MLILMLKIMKRLFMALLVLGWASGCSSFGESKPIDRLFVNCPSVQVSTAPIEIPSDRINEALGVAALGDRLLAKDYRGDPMVSVYDVDRPGLEMRIQPQGKAQSEMLRIASMYGVGDRLFLYSSMEGKVFWREKATLSEVRPARTLRAQAQKRDLYWFKMVPVAGDRYVVYGILDPSTKAQFALLDSTLNVTRYFDTFPVEGTPNEKLSFEEQSMGFQGQMTPSPDGRRMMWTPISGTVFRFYDFSGRKPVKLKEHLVHVASFDRRGDTETGVVQDGGTEIGVLGATANAKNFFALYSSKDMRERSLESSDIYVFDLRGNPVRRIVLDRPATQIVWIPGANGGRGGLYAFGRNAETLEPEIFRIRLE